MKYYRDERYCITFVNKFSILINFEMIPVHFWGGWGFS